MELFTSCEICQLFHFHLETCVKEGMTKETDETVNDVTRGGADTCND